MKELNSTAHKLLDIAEHYTQTQGFNAFSYKDLQRDVGVKTSTIHYYFPTKQDLALCMTDRYVDNFLTMLEAIATESSSGQEQLEGLAKVYIRVVSQGKFCMCGMLAADMSSLSDEVNSKLSDFFKHTEDWIAKSIQLGIEQKAFSAELDPVTSAALFLSTLEGGMLIARKHKRPNYLEIVITEVLTQFRNR